MHQNVPKLPEKRRFRTVLFTFVVWFFYHRVYRVSLPLKSQKIIKVFWSPPSNQLKTSFWCLKTRISWTSRRATFMRREYLELEGLFTSNGLFKIWNNFSRKKFLQFPQFLAKSSCLPYVWLITSFWNLFKVNLLHFSGVTSSKTRMHFTSIMSNGKDIMKELFTTAMPVSEMENWNWN